MSESLSAIFFAKPPASSVTELEAVFSSRPSAPIPLSPTRKRRLERVTVYPVHDVARKKPCPTSFRDSSDKSTDSIVGEVSGVPTDSLIERYTSKTPYAARHGYDKLFSCGELEQEANNVLHAQSGVQVPDFYSVFVESVLAEECAIWQLSRTLFVVNGWDRKSQTSSGAWYHLQQVLMEQGKSIVCFCPDARQWSCFHIRFLEEQGDERFPMNLRMPDEPNRSYLFSRSVVEAELEEPINHNIFSIASGGSYGTIKSRAIVEHHGTDSGSGSWSCSKDPQIQNCGHILLARNTLQQLIQQDLTARDLLCNKGDLIYDDIPIRQACVDDESVSYRSIPPPLWAQIPTDPQAHVVEILDRPPHLIALTTTSSCCCKPLSREFYNPNAPIQTIKCRVFGFTRMWNALIEVQKCPSCKHRFIGPDCLELGIFNWNNRTLFMHDVLEDYTCTYTTSETPFVAWVSVISRRYESRKSTEPFVSDKMFRAVWFAYAKLLELNEDMTCPKCGPSPEATIWDGVTLAFSRKHILPSLRPPTTIHFKSRIRSNTHYPVRPQYLESVSLRRNLRKLFSGHTNPEGPVDASRMNSPKKRGCGKRPKTSVETKQISFETNEEWLECLKLVTTELLQVDNNLATLLLRYFSGVLMPDSRGSSVPRGKCGPDVYKVLFIQLGADESALQLTNRPVLRSLEKFLSSPNLDNVPVLTGFPALYNVVLYELTQPGASTISDDTSGVCRWMLRRGLAVLFSMLSAGERPEKDVDFEADTGHWRQTGSCYGMPQIRYRPYYPKLAKDGQLDKGGQDSNGEGCQKYYQTYGQHRQTGGLMVVWCTHSVCYGFHCIPMAEGRNEVFSAIYTHWEKAPKFIVYDFACNLQPYCMTREPEFFADTTFLIDLFHSAGHTKCGKAAFLSNYLDTNPTLSNLNSSAAECGNGGLLRIRKSVSYMSQERAILYTKIYLSCWNRSRIRQMLTLKRLET